MALLALLQANVGVAYAQTPATRVDIQQPRAYGYLLGDTFERVITLELAAPYRLDVDRLPKPGRLSDWLTLAAPRITTARHAGSTTYTVRLTYQLINLTDAVLDIPVPHHEFMLVDGHETLKVLVPATRIAASMLRLNDGVAMQPDRAPRAPARPRTRVAIASAALLGALAGLAWLQWGLPGFGPARPFARARQDFRRFTETDGTAEQYRNALTLIHRAFNETAGRTVFPETLDLFFVAHARYAPARAPIERFFLCSRRCFFEDGDGATTGVTADRLPRAELAALLERLCTIERGLA